MSEKSFRGLHKLYAFITVVTLAFIATFCQIAYASDTNNITVMSDEWTYVHESVEAGQHRAETTMLVGTDEEVTYYSYVKFPMDTVAPGIINSAVLRLYYSNATVPDGTFTLYGVTQTWSAESIRYTNQPNSVYLCTASANEAGYIDFTVTESIISVIIGQYEGYGFKISYSGGTNTETVCLYTANHSDQAKKPQIIANGSLFALGNIYSDVTLPINNCGTFKFLVPTNNGVATGTFAYTEATANSTYQWEIFNIDTSGCSVIFSAEYQNRVLACDSNGNITLAYNEEYYDVPEAYRWNVFQYDENKYIIIHIATGKILTVSNNSVTSANGFTGISAQKWRIGYTYCTEMSAQEIDVFPGTYISYSKLADSIILNNGSSLVPTNSDDLSIYTLSTGSSALISLSTDTGGGVTVKVQSGTARITVGRKDTDATCTVIINIASASNAYFIKNVGSGCCIEHANSSYLKQYAFAGGTTQQWAVEVQNSGYVMLKNSGNGYYLQVSGNSSAANAGLVLASKNTSAAGQLYKLIYESRGIYFIAAKSGESNGYIIGTQSTSSGAYIGQGSSDNVDLVLGEWHFIQADNIDARLVAVPTDFDHADCFPVVIDELEAIGMDEIYQNRGLEIAGVTKNEVLYHIANSKIALIRSHGNQIGIQTADNGMHISDLETLDDDYFEYTQLVIYGACLTGKGGVTAENLVTATAAAGVNTVIGFEDIVPATGCRYWCEEFFNQLKIWHDVSDITIDEIVYCTDIRSIHQS